VAQFKGTITIADVAAAAIGMQHQHTSGSSESTCGSLPQTHPAALTTTGTAVAASAAATSPKGTSKCSSTMTPTPLMVPWLVLWGRCFLVLAQPSNFGGLAGTNKAGQWLVVQDLSHLQSWLQDSSTSAQLTAAGLSPTGLLLALQDAVTAYIGLQDADGAGAQSADLARLKVHVLGVSLSSLPLSWGCSNPTCTNLQGPNEEGIVRGKGHVCRACRMARYCGTACQAVHWKQHKPVCQAVAAAAAGDQAAV
jgi:hypothetical protein